MVNQESLPTTWAFIKTNPQTGSLPKFDECIGLSTTVEIPISLQAGECGPALNAKLQDANKPPLK
jgi:hypothetical protein